MNQNNKLRSRRDKINFLINLQKGLVSIGDVIESAGEVWEYCKLTKQYINKSLSLELDEKQFHSRLQVKKSVTGVIVLPMNYR